MDPFHPLNFFAGWTLVLLGFLSGAVLGIGFHREDFLGGYTSFRRRIVQLGHIALVALGIVNVVFSISPWPRGGAAAAIASLSFLAGGIAMPAACFLTGWRESFRLLFCIPVAALLIAVGSVLLGAAA
jgi:hypothetical protein